MKSDNNRMKLFISILLLLTLILMPLSTVAAGTYSLPDAKEYITIQDDGITTVEDSITYSISGQVNGVTRTIPLSGQQSVEDITVETPGYYNTLEVQQDSTKVTLKVWLYKDEAKTQKVSDEDVNVIFHYNILKGVKLYNDIAEFQYMSWGTGWDQPVGQLTTYITIPGTNTDTEFWNNPETYVKSSYWNRDNQLLTTYNNIPAQTGAEQRILMPKSFIRSTENVDLINKDAKAQIEKDQKDYANQQSFNDILWSIPAFLSAILILTPLGMYFKWGRSPKILYNADYESQIPTNDSPAFINAMIPGIIEEVDVNAFTATLLDLIDRKYYKMITSTKEDTIIRRLNKDTGDLKLHESDIVDFFKRFEDEKQRISLTSISKESGALSQFMNAWKIDALRDVPVTRVRQLYDKSKENLMSGYNILAIFLAIAFLLGLLMFGSGPLVTVGIILSVILIVEQIVIFFFIDTPLGTWTREGKEFHDRWKNFEKYIRDYSLIKERPPESIQVWGKILVYATALGCADEVSKNMKKYIKYSNISESVLYDNDVVSMGYLWGFNHMRTAFLPIGISNPNLGDTGFDTGSFGDIGGPGSGGFGGGGGGVF